ncbi:MAG: hypothetical protein HOV86_02645 [Thermoactinospora sp.]|nr:hypothetical protein [Thermoactinospora sp.]
MTTAPPRANTPDRINDDGSRTITTKRACNGCGILLGDITEREMQAAIHGAPMPDVRRECPTCGPTAPPPACLPMTVLGGYPGCLENDCDHDRKLGADLCDQVDEHTVCATHIEMTELGEVVHSEPWPCKYNPTAPAEQEADRG